MAGCSSPTSMLSRKNCGTSLTLFFVDMFVSPSFSWSSEKVGEPVLHQLQPLSLDSIHPHPPLLLHAEQTRRLEHLQMPGRRLPRVREHRRDLPGGHRPAVEIDRQQDLPPRRMRERGENGLVGV